MHATEASLGLLRVPIHVVYSSDGNYETVASIWSTMMNLEVLTAFARKLLLENCASAEHKQLAQRFLTAMQNRDERC
jgi:hypothetical protein